VRRGSPGGEEAHVTGTATEPEPVSTHLQTWLHRLSVRDFRNLRRIDLAPPPEGFALIGENGQGKTNLLEAIYYLRLLRSFRGARDRELVTFGASGFHLSAELHAARAREIAVGFERTGRRKRVRLDGIDVERLADALGALPAVLFSPQDAALVAGAPGARRRFLDVTLALTSRSYLTALQRYRTALAHRSAAMREPGKSVAALEPRVAVWEPALAEHGAVLLRARRDWVDAHEAHYAELCRAIGEHGTAHLRYASSVELGREDVAGALLASLERKRAIDIRRGLTHVGPHRDDLVLALDGQDLRTYGSAGQQRTAAIALRLLEAATLRTHTGTEPVVLLDDPFAELDMRRTGRILDLLNTEGRGQTILAVPREGDIPADLTRLERWRIWAGALTPAGA
jgi:DNA replication and repair protein RecF